MENSELEYKTATITFKLHPSLKEDFIETTRTKQMSMSHILNQSVLGFVKKYGKESEQ